jgi:RDD family
VTDGRILEDFPLDTLQSGAPDAAPESTANASPSSAPDREAGGASGAVAPLSARLAAAAADAAAVLLLTALAILAARLRTGATPGPSGLLWVGAFVVFLSAVATVVPIVAFGRTIGMALADLTARPGGGSPGVPAEAAFRRWLGTLATAATGGLLLFWTARDARAPTPADRLSGCALIGD